MHGSRQRGLSHLLGEVRIADESPADADDVRLALSQNVPDKIRVVDPAYNAQRHIDLFFDRFHIDVRSTFKMNDTSAVVL